MQILQPPGWKKPKGYANGVVATTSGYGQWGGMRGNILLVFSVDGK